MKRKVILISLTFIAIIQLLKGFPLVYSFMPQEMLSVYVEADGTLGITVYCIVQTESIPSDFIDDNLWGAYIKFKKGAVRAGAGYLVPDGDFDDAREKIYRWLDFFQETLNAKGYKIVNEDVHKTLNPKTHSGYIDMIGMDFSINCDFNELIDLFMSLKPNDGFLKMINKNNVMVDRILEVKISIIGPIIEDKYMLSPLEDKVYVELRISIEFPKYFEYEVGRTYVLDVNSILNYTEPIVTYSKSTFSAISVQLEVPGFNDFEFIDIKPEGLNFLRGKVEGKLARYEITNLLPAKPFLGGTVIGRIYVKFRVVQRGLTIPFEGSKIIGGLMVLNVDEELIFIIWSLNLWLLFLVLFVC
ncbi:MAG: hypothetical protein NDF54_05930 [archaeon GB-1867-035]|nr:hypothetical protein [Candidatus Culexmicrobium profundum]